MRSHPLCRKVPVAVPVLVVAAFLAICGGTAIAAVSSTSHATSLAGKGSGHYSGAYSGTFTLHWRQSGSHLRGSITLSNPRGTYSVTGRVRGKAIAFGAVSAGATYTGSVSGRSMSGTYKSGRGRGSWSARQLSS
jgi:hypothetical protein